MQDEETTQVREIRLLTELLRKHGTGALAGATGSLLPTLAGLLVFWQTLNTRDSDVETIKTKLVIVEDTARLAAANHGHIERLQADVDAQERDYHSIQETLAELAATQREMSRDLYYVARSLGLPAPPKE